MKFTSAVSFLRTGWFHEVKFLNGKIKKAVELEKAQLL